MSSIPSGLDLNQRFFKAILQPLLERFFPDLLYSAARLGSGSEVLGYDDAISTDHDWGIRLQLFISPEAYARWQKKIDITLRRELPPEFEGVSVHFGPADEEGTRLQARAEKGQVAHRIVIVTAHSFFQKTLGIDPLSRWTPVDWLSVAQQQLLAVTAGRVFHDGLGVLAPLRQKFAYFPHDIWLYILVNQWRRIAQEEHFLGRSGDAGDELGSRLMAGRLVHDLMMICFLLEKRYAPYPKWFGTAFRQLQCASELAPILHNILAASDWRDREVHFLAAGQFVLQEHNRRGLTPPIDTDWSYFHERPYRIIKADRLTAALRPLIKDKAVLALLPYLGSIDQLSDNSDLRSDPRLFAFLQPLYHVR